MVAAPAFGDFRDRQRPGDLLARFYDGRADCRSLGGGFSRAFRIPCLVLTRGAHVRAAFARRYIVCGIVVLFCQIADDPTCGAGESWGPDATVQPPLRNVELDRHRYDDQSRYSDGS